MSDSIGVPKPLLEQITDLMLKNLGNKEEFNEELLEKFSRLIQLDYLSSEEHVSLFMKTGVENLNEDSEA